MNKYLNKLKTDRMWQGIALVIVIGAIVALVGCAEGGSTDGVGADNSQSGLSQCWDADRAIYFHVTGDCPVEPNPASVPSDPVTNAGSGAG